MFTVKDLEKEDLLEVLDLPLEGGDFRLELGYGVKMVIEGVELVEVVDVKVISGSRVVLKSVMNMLFIFPISEGSDLVAIVAPMKLEIMLIKISSAYIRSSNISPSSDSGS